MKYLKVWVDFLPVLSTLNDAEVGRLFIAMLNYAATGEEPAEFQGNERFLWAVAKRDIDVAAERDEKFRQNGMKGGRPKKEEPTETKRNQTKPNETKNNQTKPSESKVNLQDKTRQDMTRQDKTLTFIDDADAGKVLEEQNRVLDAAEDAGFKVSNNVRAALINLYAENGLDKMLEGIKACTEHGVTNLAYLKAVLSGKPKKQDGFEQRDYSGEQDAALNRLLEWGKKAGVTA